MTIPQCTVTIGDLSALIGVDEIAFEGTEVWFYPNITDGDLLPLNASLYRLEPVRGVINTDGELENLDGDPGVTLLANDAALNLDVPLQWRVVFRRATALGFDREITSWWFTAPDDGDTVDLRFLAHVPGTTATGTTTNQITGVPAAVDNISDSGAFGRDVVRSTDEEAFWDLFGTVPPANLPSYMDDVLEFADGPNSGITGFPAVGETGKIYVDKSTGDSYRWTGSAYLRISDRITASGITDSTALGRSLVTAASQSAARLAVGPAVFDARDYGVVADGQTHNNVANLLDVVAQCAAAGGGTVVLPAGVIVTSESVKGATVTADSGRTYTNKGGIPLPFNTPIKIMGQGRNNTTLKLSAGFQRAFDLYLPAPYTGGYRYFRDIELCDMTIDKQNLKGTDVAANTAVVTPSGSSTTVRIPPSTDGPLSGSVVSVSDYTKVGSYANVAAFPGTGTVGNVYIDAANNHSYTWSGSAYSRVQCVWVTLPGISGVTFKHCEAVYVPSGQSGTASGYVLRGRVNPANTSQYQVMAWYATLTLNNGNTVQGTVQGHTIVGDTYIADFQGAGYAAGNLGYSLQNLYVHDIDAINVYTRTGAVATYPANYNAVAQISPQRGNTDPATNLTKYSDVQNVRFERVRGFGGEVGFCIGPGGRNSGTQAWLNDIAFIDCYHDTLNDWWLTNTSGGAGLNFMIGSTYGWLGRVAVVRCEGRRSHDVGLEVDNPWHAIEVDCVWRDTAVPLFFQNFSVPARTSAGPVTTTLKSATNSSVTTAVFQIDMTAIALSAANFVDRAGVALIDTELCWYEVTAATGGSSPEATVTLWRGLNGTSAASHSAGATVTFVETHKTAIHSVRSRIENSNGVSTRAISTVNFGFPLSPLTITDATVILHGGWGNFLLSSGWRSELTIQGCTFVQNQMYHNQVLPTRAAISVTDATAAMYDDGVPITPSRITGRGNSFSVNGVLTSSGKNNYYSVFAPNAGWYLVDWESHDTVVLSRQSATQTARTASVMLDPTKNLESGYNSSTLPSTGYQTLVYQNNNATYHLVGFSNTSNDWLFTSGNHWAPITNKLILDAGSRIRTVARIVDNADPVGYRLGSATDVTVTQSVLGVFDLAGTLSDQVDSTQTINDGTAYL